MEAAGVPVVYCPRQTRVAKYARGIELARIFRQHKVQLLHTHNTTAFIDSTVGARLAQVPVLINTDHCKNYPIAKRWMYLERGASLFADKIVAVSNHTRDELIHYERIDSDKVQVIYNGINVRLTRNESPAVLRAELGIHEHDIVIGTAGRLEAQKGLDLFIGAMPIILQRLPEARFVIVGGGSLEGALKEQAARLKVDHRTIFTGSRVDAVDIVQLLDCFVSTSNFEGMPMALLEAMALAKPIVATAVGGVPEVVLDGYNGHLIRSRDPQVVANAVLGILTSPARRSEFGANGRRRYDDRFTAEAMARAYEGLYDTYVDHKRLRRS
jgi:glycosyltransferase involved in cell wall biosynthesis